MVVDLTVRLHHAESIIVVGEVVGVFMVPWTCLVGHVGGYGFDLSHEFVPHSSIVRIHIVREISDMQDCVDCSSLRFVLEKWDGVAVNVACREESNPSHNFNDFEG